MAAVKCPGCSATFKVVSTSARIACPKCGTKFSASGAARQAMPGDDEAPASSRRQIIMGIVAVFALLYLVGGIALAMYLMKGSKKPSDQAVASAETEKERPKEQVTPIVEAPAPVNVPVQPGPMPVEPQPARPVQEPMPVAAAPVTDGLSADQRAVNQAIDRGTEYLKSQLRLLVDGPVPQGMLFVAQYREGLVALLGYTLLECGVPSSDPLTQKAAAYLRAQSTATRATYSLATMIIFFDRLGDPKDKPIIRRLALRLALGQGEGGIWDYTCPLLTTDEEQHFFTFLQAIRQRQQPAPLPPRLRPYPLILWLQGRNPQPGAAGDHSNTQFAVLGLWVALRHDLPVQAPLLLAEWAFRATQLADGSWGYLPHRGEGTRSSMTCSGLLAISIGRSLRSEDKKRDLATEKAFAYIGKTFLSLAKPGAAPAPEPGAPGVPAVPPAAPAVPPAAPGAPAAPPAVPAVPAAPPAVAPAAPVALPSASRAQTIGSDSRDDFYFLWSLQRVALLYDLKTIAGEDWYQWASQLTVRVQQADGSWIDDHGRQVDTCFALLILKRTSVVKDLTVQKEITASVKEIVSIKKNDAK